MSCSMTSPSRTPASKPAATMSDSSSVTVTSSVTPGWAAAKLPISGPERKRSAIEVTATRSTPREGPSTAASSSAAPTVDSGSAICRCSASPASVRRTWRVERWTSAMPRLSSSRRMPWLTAERVTPRWSAAARKFCAFATARKKRNRLKSASIG